MNNIRTGTDITDKIRLETDKADRYGSPIRSVRSVPKLLCDLGITVDKTQTFQI